MISVLLDTNVILRAISSKSSLAPIFDSLLEQDYSLVVSTEVLLEYEEKIIKFYGKETAVNLLEFLLVLPNVRKIEPFFSLNLITQDPDDNKFVDVAFAANATFIITDDKHFNVLSRVKFPQINVVNSKEFLEYLSKKSA